MTAAAPAPVFDHLLNMTDRRGTFEQANLAEPVAEHGYCTDDMARVLVVVSREEPDPARRLNPLAGLAFRFVEDALALSGACHNRMDSSGKWTDEPTLEDGWGRCIWALGTAAAHANVAYVRGSAKIQFERAALQRSTSPRAMAYAALGAAELLTADPDHVEARELLTYYVRSIIPPSNDPAWPWPEPRLGAANAVLAEAMIAAGTVLDDAALQKRGLDLLAWLVDYETVDGHFSPTPVGGRGADDVRPGFDQQPIEVASLADACARAASADPSPAWPDGVRRAAAWFDGDNDSGQVMWDAQTGGGFDGLHADGVNRNQGAESTLAVLSTMQHARRISAVRQ
jgi:hypothetical protein